MIKFDPHEDNSILAGLQMFAPNADWHQRLPDNHLEEEEEYDNADAYDQEYGVVGADQHHSGFADQNDDNNVYDEQNDDAANDVFNTI